MTNNLVRTSSVWSDEAVLEVLYMRDHLGMTAKGTAAAIGTTKNAIIGLWNRIDKAQQPGTYGDGTMAADWWRR